MNCEIEEYYSKKVEEILQLQVIYSIKKAGKL